MYWSVKYTTRSFTSTKKPKKSTHSSGTSVYIYIYSYRKWPPFVLYLFLIIDPQGRVETITNAGLYKIINKQIDVTNYMTNRLQNTGKFINNMFAGIFFVGSAHSVLYGTLIWPRFKSFWLFVLKNHLLLYMGISSIFLKRMSEDGRDAHVFVSKIALKLPFVLLNIYHLSSGYSDELVVFFCFWSKRMCVLALM